MKLIGKKLRAGKYGIKSSSGPRINFYLINIMLIFFANFNKQKIQTNKANFHTKSPAVKLSEDILKSLNFSYSFLNVEILSCRNVNKGPYV